MQNFPDNTLYEMDNLPVLRGMNSETVDLIATDPPFNTKRNRSGTAGHYVDKWKWGDTGILPDQWKWNEVHPKWLEEIKDDNPALFQVIEAARVCHDEDIAAFLCFLSVRLLECHRILKPTGSLYLHCDHAANSYIRMAMSAIFGKNNLRNEIIWCYSRPSAPKQRQLSRVHDTIFWFSKGKQWTFNPDAIRQPYAYSSREREGYSAHTSKVADGSVQLDNRGKFPESWIYISPLKGNSREYTGSPDQKPLALYERIIKASSNEGDLVLDPFCGCATTIIAARNFNRRWVGIDRRLDAKYHIVCRIAGIDTEERDRLVRADPEWAQKQMDKYEAHYADEAPKRSDEGDTAAPELEAVYPVAMEYGMRHEEMHRILIDQFGLQCWGCDFKAPDARYLELDHINPRSGSKGKHLDLLNNRALLCRPCNQKKSNRITLVQLRKENEKAGYLKQKHPIDLGEAGQWTWEYLAQLIRETPHQFNLDRH